MGENTRQVKVQWFAGTQEEGMKNEYRIFLEQWNSSWRHQ